MKISILTLFPDIFLPILQSSILKRAQGKKLVTIDLVNIRDFAKDTHKTVDDKPYGGGVGMLLKVDVLFDALASVLKKSERKKTRVILLDPKGELFNQQIAKKLTHYEHLVFVCGHYEGVDARFDAYIDEKISIGNYVLTGGEIPSMVLTDAIVRLLPGVITDGAVDTESFEGNLLEYPQYTRPAEFKKKKVPSILLSGDHKKISLWQNAQRKKVK